MAAPKRRPSTEDAPVYRFALTKVQVGALAAGFAALMTLFFSLGYILAEREGGERAAGAGRVASARGRPGVAAVAAGPRETTVALAPEGRKEPGTDSARGVELGFYKTLLEKEPENLARLAPIPLPMEKPKPKGVPASAWEPTPAAPPAERPREKRIAAAAQGAVKASAPAPARLPERLSPPPAPRAAPGAVYTIQIASVRERDRAERILRQLERVGYSAFIDRAELRGQGTWYRVRLGRFPDRRSASRVLARIEERISLRGGRIVSL